MESVETHVEVQQEKKEKKKRAPSAYNLFVQEHIKANPTGLPKERLKSAGMAWKLHKESQM